MYENEMCCFEWRGHRVVLSGCSQEMSVELSATLALELCQSHDGDIIDIVISCSGSDIDVRYNRSRDRFNNQPDLLIHLATLVAAAFVEKVNFPNRLHAAGFMLGEGATLLSGPAYYGKSNLSFLAWSRGHQVLGDDWLYYSTDSPEVSPLPKPLKPRVRPVDLHAMSALCASRPHTYGSFRGEHRLMVGRSEGFYNNWDRPVHVDHFVFLEKSESATSHIEAIRGRDALPLLLAQTLLDEATMTLQAVTFAKSLLAAGTPIYTLSVGSEAYDEAFDLMVGVLLKGR